MNDPMPLAVADPGILEHAHEMAPIARLAAHGMRRGQLVEDHPTSFVFGPEGDTKFGMRVTLDEDDPFLAACGIEVREGLRDFHLVLDLHFQYVVFHLLPIDRTKPACCVTWSMRDDKSEIDFPTDPTNHDIAAIADRAAAMLDSVVDESHPDALEGAKRLSDAARTLRMVAFAQIGMQAEVTVLSNDHGCDLIVLSDAVDDPKKRDIHHPLELRMALADPRPQIRIGRGSAGPTKFESPDGTEDWEWPHEFGYTVARRTGESKPDADGEATDVMEAMREAARYSDIGRPLAWLSERVDRTDDESDEEGI